MWSKRGFLIIVLTLVYIMMAAHISGWSSFRGDEKNSGTAETVFDPVKLNVDWEYRSDGEIQGVVVGEENRIAFTTRNGSVYVLDAQEGAFVYKRQPATERIHANPVIVREENGLIISTDNGKVIRYDMNSGDEVWHTDLGNSTSVKVSPNYRDDTLVITTEGSDIYCLDIDDGSFRWNFTGCGGRAETSPSFYSDGDKDLVIFGACDGNLYALDRETGDLDWYYSAREIPSSSAIFDDKVVFGSFDQHLYCLDAGSGELVWRSDLGAPVFSSPSVDEKGIAVGTDEKGPVLLSWSGEVLLEIDLGTSMGSSPVLLDDMVIVNNENGMFVLSREDGAILRGFELGDADDTSPSVIGDTIYFGDKNGYVRAVREKDENGKEPLDMGEEDDPGRDLFVLVVGSVVFIVFCILLYIGYRKIRKGGRT